MHRFDPTPEHMGGAGSAFAYLGAGSPYFPPHPATTANAVIGDQSLKQGAYGKVSIHKHSKMSQIAHIDEIFSALWFKYGASMTNKVYIYICIKTMCVYPYSFFLVFYVYLYLHMKINQLFSSIHHNKGTLDQR